MQASSGVCALISTVMCPKEVCLHNSAALGLALRTVNLEKHANSREGAITDKTGGCKSESDRCGKNVCLNARDNIKGNVSRQRETGGAVLTSIPIS